MHPTRQPTDGPTSEPTGYPSEAPSVSMNPSDAPTAAPSSNPSNEPSLVPSNSPSYPPTPTPSSDPSTMPSHLPSSSPTGQPSSQPSRLPSATPSFVPSSVPTVTSSDEPSLSPTVSSAPNTAAPSHRPSSSMAPSAQPSEEVIFGQDVAGSARLSPDPDSEASEGSSLSTTNLVIIFIVGLALGAFGFWAVGWYRRKAACRRELDESGSADDGAKTKDQKPTLVNLKAGTKRIARTQQSEKKGEESAPGRTTRSASRAEGTASSGVESKRPLSPTQRMKDVMADGKATLAKKRQKRREVKKGKTRHRSTTQTEVASRSVPRFPLSPTQRIKDAMVEGKTELAAKMEQRRKAKKEKAQQREPRSFFVAPISPRLRRANMKLKMSRDHQRFKVTNRAGVKGDGPHVVKKPVATIAELKPRDDKMRNSGRSARRSSNRSEEVRRRLEDLEKRERADIDETTRLRSRLSELEKREREDYDEVQMMRSVLSGSNAKPPAVPSGQRPGVKHRPAPTTTRPRGRPPRPMPQPVSSTGRHRSRTISSPRARPSSRSPSRRAREQQSIFDVTSATTASTRSESMSRCGESTEEEYRVAAAADVATMPPQQMMRPITDAQVPLLSNSESTHFSIVYTAEQNQKRLEHNRQSLARASSGWSTPGDHNRVRFDSFPSASSGSSAALNHNRGRFDSSQTFSSRQYAGKERRRPSYR